MNRTPMTNDEIYEWVILLESGLFKQTCGQLRLGDSHCCLGIACLVRDGNVEWAMNGKCDALKFHGDIIDGFPPRWFLPDRVLEVPPHLQGKSHGCTSELADYLNDADRFTFAEIAQCIRYTYPEIFA